MNKLNVGGRFIKVRVFSYWERIDF